MENENTYHFRTINGIPQIVTEKNTRMTYLISRERHIGRIAFSYTRVKLTQTAKARVVYFMYNNAIARFKRALVPTITQKLDEIGISVSVTQ